MNLKDFCNNQPKDEPKKDTQQKILEQIDEGKFKEIEDDYGDLVNEFISKYGTMSEPELLQSMLKLIAEKKAEGTFDAKKIKALAEQIAPLLEPEQRAKMYNLLNYLE